MIKDYSNSDYKSKIRIKKDYKIKKFSNPYFSNVSKKETSGGFNTKLYLKIILVIFLVYVIIYSDLFKIKSIKISGAELINQIELEQIIDDQLQTWRWRLLPQKNVLFTSKKKITRAISERYGLDEIEIKRGWQKITINIKERISYLIINSQSKFYFADKQGIIIREVPTAETVNYQGEFPILNLPDEINIGSMAVTAKMVEFILNLNDRIKTLGIEAESYQSGGPTEITLITKTGWQAHFDINNDLDISIENMQMVLNNKVKDLSSLEYIDLRFGDKIYYK